MAEIDLTTVTLPEVPQGFVDERDGSEWYERAERFGWLVPGRWGSLGWDLGCWPYTFVGLFDDETAGVWALVLYEEGDITTRAFDTEKERDQAVTTFAVNAWRQNPDMPDGQPDDLPATGWLPQHEQRYHF